MLQPYLVRLRCGSSTTLLYRHQQPLDSRHAPTCVSINKRDAPSAGSALALAMTCCRNLPTATGLYGRGLRDSSVQLYFFIVIASEPSPGPLVCSLSSPVSVSPPCGHDDEPEEHEPLSTRRHPLDTSLLFMCSAENTMSTPGNAEQRCQQTTGYADGSQRITRFVIVTCAW